MPSDRPSVWVVVLNYNGLADTRKCLRSLQALRYQPCSTVLVDNSSTDDPCPALRQEFPWCHVLRSPINSGWAGGNNIGIRYALERGADQVLLLNNDTVVSPDLIGRLVAAAEAHPEYGVIGPVVRFLEGSQEVMTDGGEYGARRGKGFFHRKEVPLQVCEPPTITDVDQVIGCAMMVAAPVFQQIGLVDERFFLVHEESDFCLRAAAAGFRCGVIGEALVWHKGSSSFQRTGKGLQRYYDARNLVLLLRKHYTTAPRRRGLIGAFWEYLRYVYHRYSIEQEHGQPVAADAVLNGMCDGLAGRYGAFVPRPRRAVPVLRWVFESYRRRRSLDAPETGGSSHAPALHQATPGLAPVERT